MQIMGSSSDSDKSSVLCMFSTRPPIPDKEKCKRNKEENRRLTKTKITNQQIEVPICVQMLFSISKKTPCTFESFTVISVQFWY